MFYKLKAFLRIWFFPYFCFLLLSTIVISCNQIGINQPITETSVVLTEKPADETASDEEVSIEEESSSRTSCRRSDTYSEEISITDLEFVDSNNVGDYLLKGRCEARDSLVYIKVNGYKTSNNPKCDKGRWEVSLDLTSVATEEEKIIFSLSHNGEKICKEVRVAFIGPKNYVPISTLEDYYESGFML